MAFETVTGYCWPQSATAGDQVGVHLSSSGARSVHIEVARVGGEREVVLVHDKVDAGDHPLPRDAWREGCDWPPATAITVYPHHPKGAPNHGTPFFLTLTEAYHDQASP